jgi:molecular chaperone GrpE
MTEKDKLENQELDNEKITSEQSLDTRDEDSHKDEETVDIDEEPVNKVEETEEVQAELSVEEKLRAENQELKDKYLRLYSEFENYRRRTAKERLDLIKTASERVIIDLIPILDDFERALKTDYQENDKLMEGNHLIYNKLSKTLENKGLKPMGDLVGTAFDAETQEAITMAPAPTDDLKGKIIDVVEKGYTLGEKVVRFAKVVIGS